MSRPTADFGLVAIGAAPAQLTRAQVVAAAPVGEEVPWWAWAALGTGLVLLVWSAQGPEPYAGYVLGDDVEPGTGRRRTTWNDDDLMHGFDARAGMLG